MTRFDVAIVGGGLVGCAAALFLRRRGASVVLLERRACGSQASGVNYGGVRQQGRHPAELPLARRSRALWQSLPDLIGTDGEFVATGHLKLARSEKEAEELEAYAMQAARFGLRLELVGRRALRERYPWLAEAAVAGSFCAEDGHANPRLVAPAFARRARALGATIHEGAEVRAVALSGGEFAIETAGGGTFRAGRLLNAAGAWGAQIAAQFGEDVPETVMAPNMCVTEPLPHFILPNLGVCGGAIYIRQIARGNVIFGAGLGRADRDQIRAFADAAATREAARRAIGLVPRLASATLIRTWSGIEGRTPDMLPVLGPSGTTPGLFHAFGFSGHGFQLGPAVGAVLAELSLEGRTSTEVDALTIARFAARSGQQPASINDRDVTHARAHSSVLH